MKAWTCANPFGEFAGGFMQGIGPSIKSLLNALSGMTGPNWTNVGKTFGQMAGDLLQLLPPLTTVVSDVATLFGWLSKIPGAILAMVIAWEGFKGVLAFAQILTGFTNLLGLIGKVGVAASGAGAAAAGSEAAAGAGAGAAGAAGLGADAAAATGEIAGLTGALTLLAPAAAAAGLALWGLNTKLSPHPHAGGPVGLGLDLAARAGSHLHYQLSGEAAAIARSMAILGNGPRTDYNPNRVMSGIGAGTVLGSKQWVADIKLHTQNIIQVAGPLSPEAQAQIEMLFAKHDSQLAGKLMQLRPAH